MGRPKGSLQQNKTAINRSCQRCGKSFIQYGSGRPKKNCCKKPKKLKLEGTQMSRGKETVLKDKLLRGECALHPKYHQGRRKFVTLENHRMFAYDHIDRSIKKDTIAKIVDAGKWQLERELLKCQLLCHNCHAMKTYEDKDWVAHDQTFTDHPTLFDND